MEWVGGPSRTRNVKIVDGFFIISTCLIVIHDQDIGPHSERSTQRANEESLLHGHGLHARAACMGMGCCSSDGLYECSSVLSPPIGTRAVQQQPYGQMRSRSCMYSCTLPVRLYECTTAVQAGAACIECTDVDLRLYQPQ
jgi:hypothetical protein